MRLGWVLGAVVALSGLGASALWGEALGASEGVRGLRVLTWNVQAQGLGEQAWGWLGMGSGRASALLREARSVEADLVAFEEVDAPFLAALAEDEAGDGAWAGFGRSFSGEGAPPGGLLLLSRLPLARVEAVRLPSALGRAALLAWVDLGGESLVVAVVHLESPLGDGFARKAQMAAVQRHLPRLGLSLWLGDFNFGDGAPEAAKLAGWSDAWKVVRPGEAGFTYDLGANARARAGAFSGEASRRLDRVLSSRRLVPVAVGLVGVDAPPSDHFGVWADLRVVGP